VASHIAPSKIDRRGMWRGLIIIIITLIFINILTLLMKINITDYILTFADWISIFTALFAYATIISFIHFVASYLILRPFRKY
jgi:sterol desaturase/sphingolipid hydroxylase (fatty acid hydroxylase superfamily)